MEEVGRIRGTEGRNEAKAVEWVARGGKSEGSNREREIQRGDGVSRRYLITQR